MFWIELVLLLRSADGRVQTANLFSYFFVFCLTLKWKYFLICLILFSVSEMHEKAINWPVLNAKIKDYNCKTPRWTWWNRKLLLLLSKSAHLFVWYWSKRNFCIVRYWSKSKSNFCFDPYWSKINFSFWSILKLKYFLSCPRLK